MEAGGGTRVASCRQAKMRPRQPRSRWPRLRQPVLRWPIAWRSHSTIWRARRRRLPTKIYFKNRTDVDLDPNNGLRRTDSPAQCCALCQGLKNCSFWTYEFGGTAAKPTCLGQPGNCCYLKTAAAKGLSAPDPVATSGDGNTVPYCMDALPNLHMTSCDGTAISQDWTTAGGIIKEAKSAAPGLCLRTSTAPAPPAPPPLGVLFDVEVDLTVGVVIEATLSCANPSTSAGFLVNGNSGETTFLWNCAAQTFTVGGGSPIDRKPGFAAGAAVALKMLLVRPRPATPA
jgi:hypothetical protein